MNALSTFAISCDKSDFILSHSLGGSVLKIIYNEVNEDFIVKYINGDTSVLKVVRFLCDDFNRQNIESRLECVAIVP